jgi:hypothetical protein
MPKHQILKEAMKFVVLWNIKPCSPVKINRRFVTTHRLDLLLVTCFKLAFLFGLFLNPKDGGDMFLRNVS